MKKCSMLLLVGMLALSLTACGNAAQENMPPEPTASADVELSENSPSESDALPDSADNERILVVYYSLSGNTESVAQRLQTLTGGDVYEIELETPYAGGTNEISDQARQEVATGNYPVLKGTLPDLSTYDVILMGGPVWSRTLSSPLISFIEQLDFSDKLVAPFWTDAGTPGDYEEEFGSYMDTASAAEGLGLSRVSSMDDVTLDETLSDWLTRIGVIDN